MTDEIIQLLSNNPDFIDDFSGDLKCSICGQVLKDAHYAPCGCDFCKLCIANYLGNEDKFCPGNLDECQERLINFANDIRVNPTTNRRIKNLNIKCKNNGCGVSCCVGEMINHEQICDYRLHCCPFSMMGCDAIQMSPLQITNHISSQLMNHFELIINSMTQENEIVKNQLNELQIDKEESRNRIITLEQQIQSSSTKIGQLETENEQMKQHIQYSTTKIGLLETENEQIKQQIQSSTTIIGLLETENEQIKQHIQYSTTKIGQLETENEQIKQQIQSSKTENGQMKQQIQSSTTKIGQLETDNGQMKQQIQSSTTKIGQLETSNKPIKAQNIFVRDKYTSKEYKFKINSATTIKSVGNKYKETLGNEEYKFEFLFQDQRLDENMTVAYYGIEEDDKILSIYHI